MDVFKNIYNMKEKRLSQLKKREEQYTILRNNKNECSNDIMTYLLNINKINWIHYRKIYKQSFFKLVDCTFNNLNEIDNEIDVLDDIVNSDNLCEKLKQYISVQEKYIDEYMEKY